METVTSNITTNPPTITTTQPSSGVCETCTDLMITSGVLGGISIVVTAVVLVYFFGIKRFSDIYSSQWKYDLILAVLAVVSYGSSLSAVITLAVKCAKIDPRKCSVGYGWIGIACFVFMTVAASLAITAYLRYRKGIYEQVSNLQEKIMRAKQLCNESKKLFSDIKTTDKDAAEIKNEIQRKINEWRNQIAEATELVQKIQGTGTKEGEPFIVDNELEKKLQSIQPNDRETIPENFQYLQYLKDAQESGHENNIQRLDHEASKEVEMRSEEISPDTLISWREDDETFFATKSTELIYKTVKHKGYLISGLPGAGKTANVKHIALRFKRDGYRLCCVDGIKELIDKTGKFETGEKQVYAIDDVFGVHGVNDKTVTQWTEKYKDDIKRCLDKSNIILLCSSRVQVVNDKKLSNIIKSYFTVTNISEEEAKLPNEERSKERVEIFRKHASVKERVDLLTDGVHLKAEIENKIKHIECPAGCFPFMCRLYVGDKETNQTIENYFNNPLDQIHEHIQSLQNSPSEGVRLGYFCLLMCMIYDNKVPVNTMEVGKEEQETKNKRQELLELCELPVSTSRPTIKNKMDTLLLTFVKREGNTYQFVHHIIQDAVIKHVNGLTSSFHKFILRYCTSKFMMNRVHLSGTVCKDPCGGSGHDTESCINIRPDSFTCWGVRVLDIVRDGVRTSDQLYNDIDEGRCSKDDDDVLYNNPWWDVLLHTGCVHSTEGQTAIVKALACKSPSDVETILCTKGYSLYGRRVTGLHWAISAGLTHIVTQTLPMLSQTQLQELDSIHEGLVNWAIGERCGTDVIQALIVGGLDVNTLGVCGDTPLHQYVILGDYKTTQLLVDKGAGVNQCDTDGTSVLYKSQLRGHDTITELLQSRGAVCMYKGKQYNNVTDIYRT